MFVKAGNFAEMALGLSVDTRVRHDGQVELASRNGFSNPDLRDVGESGPDGVELLAGPEATGRHIYVRLLNDEAGAPQRDTRLTRQNSAPARLQGNYALNEPIIEGSEPPDVSARAPIPAPPAPEVEIVATAGKGFKGPLYYGFAICYITGNPRRAGQMRFTPPGPTIVPEEQVQQGNYVRLFFSARDLPEGVSGIGILQTEGQATIGAAEGATLYFQRILDARRGLRSPYPLRGPLRTLTKAKTENETYVGALGEHPPPRFNYGPLAGFTLRTFQTQISYQLRTPTGESADQQFRSVDTTGKGEASATRSFGSGLSTVTYTAVKSGNEANRVRVVQQQGQETEVESTGTFPAKTITITFAANATAADVAKAVNASTASRWVKASTPFLPGSGAPAEGNNTLAGGISGAGRALHIRLPRNAASRFEGATEWRLKFMGPDGLWYAEHWQPIGTKAVMISNNPADYHPSNEPEQTGRAREDETGIPAPDSELEAPEIFGPTLPAPGRYAIRESLEAEGDDNKESPPSAATIVTIAQGQYMRVLPSEVGNRLPNSELEEEDPETGDPLDWILNRSTNLAIDAVDNKLVIKDTTLSTSIAAAAAIAPRRSITTAPQCLRVVGEMTRRVSGFISVNARYFDAAGAHVGSQILASMTSEMDAEISVGVAGSGAQYIAPTGTASVTFAVALNGATGDARDFDAELYHHGIWRGLAAPRKRTEKVTTITEDPSEEYPAGPYSVLLEDARVVEGQTVSAVEHYAPYGTPANPDSLLKGYATPLNPGQEYTPSVYVEYAGVSLQTDLLTVAIKDARGRTIETFPALVPGVVGSQAETRVVAPTFTAPADAAYMEIVSGDASDGRVTVYAFQLDEGAVSPYTAENALSGTHTVTLDTRIPRIDEDPRLPWLSAVREWRDGKAISTEDVGTDVTLRFRSTEDDPDTVASPAWSAWGTFEGTPKQRYWQIEATLTSTDATVSPLVSWLGLELIRPHSMLLRPDGTEYPGAVQVPQITGPRPLPIFESVVSDSNVSTRRSRGKKRDQRKMDIQAYMDEALDMVFEDICTGQPLIVESWDLQRRLAVVIEPPEFDVDRQKALRGTGATPTPPAAWLHDSEGIEIEVTGEEAL